MIAAAPHCPWANAPEPAGPLPGPAGSPARPAGAQSLLPLGLLVPGERAEVVEAAARPHGACASRTEEMGLRSGKVVEVLANSGGGPLLVKVEESRLAIGRGVAMTIMVRRGR